MKTLIVFSHLRWNFVFQRPQHLLTRLSKFYNILFVEEPLNTGSVFLEATLVAPNIMTLVPHTAEQGWGFNDEQVAVIGPMLKGWLEEHANLTDSYGIWFYTPQALPLRDFYKSEPTELNAFNYHGDTIFNGTVGQPTPLGAPEFVVFDVMDELSMFAHAPMSLKIRELELLVSADLVIAGGPSLARAKQEVRPDTLSLPSSVDAEHYSPARAEAAEASTHDADQLEHDIPHPRIGFFGVIDERLDIDLVAAVADANPHWQVVMVGPVVKINPDTLPKRSNIHYLGSQPYALLPQLVQQWDVCMMPFAINDATKFISPTKTLEYMAAEKPIVSTAIHDVIELYGSVVEVGNTHEEFISLIEMLLNEDPINGAARVIQGKELVKQYSWDETADKVHQAIEAAIAKKVVLPV